MFETIFAYFIVILMFASLLFLAFCIIQLILCCCCIALEVNGKQIPQKLRNWFELCNKWFRMIE